MTNDNGAAGKVVAWGMPNSAISGNATPLMMVRIDTPSDDQYGGALWVPLVLASDYEALRTELDTRDSIIAIAQASVATLRAQLTAAEQRAAELGADAARMNWLDQNVFHREMDSWDKRTMPNSRMWAMFGPDHVQGSARRIIDAAMAREDEGATQPGSQEVSDGA